MGPPPIEPRRWTVWLLLLTVTAPLSAAAQGPNEPATASSTSSATRVSTEPRIAQVRALMAGSLDPTVSPQSLFDVPLSDEAAIRVESARIRALLRAADDANQRKGAVVQPGRETLDADLQAVEPSLWEQRLELDRARLEFYALDREQRERLLRAHLARQESSKPRESDDERQQREAQEARSRALEAAKAARTEMERLIGEELARLNALETRITSGRQHIRDVREHLATARDAVLGWQRRVRDAASSGSMLADSTFDALGGALETFGAELSSALDDRTIVEVPELGEDALANRLPDTSTGPLLERRSQVELQIADLRRDEEALRQERTSALIEEISILNRERLGLLGHLSSEKLGAVTGFTAAGWEQAVWEARHLSNVLRYHQRVAGRWLVSWREGSTGLSAWTTARIALPMVLLFAAFLWGRNRSRTILAALDDRQRTDRTSPSFLRTSIRLLARIHRPLEWLVFLLLLRSLMPRNVRELLEVQLATSIMGWILLGGLFVNTVNAVVMESTRTRSGMQAEAIGQLRLRSLQVVARTVVVFGLILLISERLVGAGIIYGWVLSTCWIAGAPILLLLLRWWRPTIFERLDRIRSKSPLQVWVLTHRQGWKSFLAATVGAVHILGTRGFKTLRGWTSRFDLARRVHAYLFKRGIERLGGTTPGVTLRTLDATKQSHLDPELLSPQWIDCPGTRWLEALDQRLSRGQGGFVAVVGARGMGKSSMLQALASRSSDTVTISCTSQTTVSDIQAAMQTRDSTRAVLLDDAHALTRPCIGGLKRFDDVADFARQSSEVVWIFAIDASVWPFLMRARDAHPLFDEVHVLAPWTEGQIGILLADRCARAGIVPTYDDLLEPLAPGSDDLDRQDALGASQAGYERMLWDHAGGNPALALEAWRSSLLEDENGVVHVRSLQTPLAGELESLPDSSLFVLRAVLQLAPTSAEAVAEATRIRPEQVLQDIRFGRNHGYFTGVEGSVRVSWAWTREVTRLLERRHLLVTT